jgi:hypothetical protein
MLSLSAMYAHSEVPRTMYLYQHDEAGSHSFCNSQAATDQHGVVLLRQQLQQQQCVVAVCDPAAYRPVSSSHEASVSGQVKEWPKMHRQ